MAVAPDRCRERAVSGAERHAVIDAPDQRERRRVFRDREHAGRVLAGMLERYRGTDALVLAIPAGGVPVAATLAEVLHLALDVAVVSKITLPWNTECGYGAVAFDGTVRLNQALLQHLRLTEHDVRAGIDGTRAKVERRVRRFRGDAPLPSLSGRPVILVDDGLASGFTMLVAIAAVRAAGADEVLVAVPTGHTDTVRRVAHAADAVYCANVRSAAQFAVADAYAEWRDVGEDEAIHRLGTGRRHAPAS